MTPQFGRVYLINYKGTESNWDDCHVQNYIKGPGCKFFRVTPIEPTIDDASWVERMVNMSEASRWEKHKAGRLIKANEGRGEHSPWLNMVCWKAIFDRQDMTTLIPWIDEDKHDPALKEIGPSVWRVVLNCSNQVAALRATGSEDILYWLESVEYSRSVTQKIDL
jgi:hypothetical protein